MELLKSYFRGCSAKFMLIVGTGLLSVSVVVGVAYFDLLKLSHTITQLTESRIPIAITIGDMRNHVHGIGQEILLASLESDAKKRSESIMEVQERLLNMKDKFTFLMSQPLKPENHQRLETAQTEWNQLSGQIEETMKVIEAKPTQNEAIAEAVHMNREIEVFNAHLDVVARFNNERNDEIKAGSLLMIRETNQILITVSAVAFLLLLAFGFLMATQIRNSLTEITHKINHTGLMVTEASTQLNGASKALADGQMETAASLEETVASVEELSSIVSKNAEQSQLAAKLSKESEEIARMGKSEVEKLITSVQSIAASSKKIDDIITIIDDIAFQTNLLALNASVEAARAGEQGKGFAVVADAVRALAQRSATAAKDISSLIKDSVNQSALGAQFAHKSGIVLEKVTESISRVSVLNKEIAEASMEQSTGLRQISQAMNQLDQATQTNSASAEQTAATSEEMSQQAVVLSSLVTGLQVVVQGRAA